MRCMPERPSQSKPSDFDAERAKQEEIAVQIVSDAPVKSTPEAAGTPVEPVEEQPKITLRSVNVDAYPLGINVVGATEELVFDDADATIDVPPQVAEQTTFIEQIEIVA